MFLHETGEDSDSFSRQDLSSLNAASSQRPAPSSGIIPIAKPSQAPSSSAIMTGPTSSNSQVNKAESMSRSDSGGGDGSALPNTANWAKNPQVEQSRRSSQAASRATPSPKTTSAKPTAQQPESSNSAVPSSAAATDARSKQSKDKTVKDREAAAAAYRATLPPHKQLLHDAILSLEGLKDFPRYKLDRKAFTEEQLKLIDNFPPVIDPNGGIKWLLRKRREEEERKKQESEKAEPLFTSHTAD